MNWDEYWLLNVPDNPSLVQLTAEENFFVLRNPGKYYFSQLL